MATLLIKSSTQRLHCVPKHSPISDCDVKNLSEFIYNNGKLLVVTGAGISTESGIPDYRSEEVGLYSRKRLKPYRPIQHGEFVSDSRIRQRYWLRNYVGWPTFSKKEPNITHFSLTKLENKNKLVCIITQNVDSLHFKAKSKNVVELHGTAFRVKCLNCGMITDRNVFQDTLKKLNDGILIENCVTNPDGDVDIDENLEKHFTVPDCYNCGGIIQPDIVFFGGTIPKERHAYVEKIVDNSDSLLVLGTSLSVFSSYRILLRAHERKKSIAIVNIGSTRGEQFASLKISGRCGEILPLVC
ncbi:unnamed protein product [Nezara viridula]|uniref:Deacetylase sirtuin-type domain-containing protein n=1 Tax=Nezara viridula TaxID=85310 RepID=A0A9P0EFZ2_NEZVI|nr:unnamed protein product [Nezara viridula]